MDNTGGRWHGTGTRRGGGLVGSRAPPAVKATKGGRQDENQQGSYLIAPRDGGRFGDGGPRWRGDHEPLLQPLDQRTGNAGLRTRQRLPVLRGQADGEAQGVRHRRVRSGRLRQRVRGLRLGDLGVQEGPPGSEGGRQGHRRLLHRLQSQPFERTVRTERRIASARVVLTEWDAQSRDLDARAYSRWWGNPFVYTR